MLIFFLIVFAIYFGANSYLFYKGYNVFPKGKQATIYTISFIILVSLFIAGKILERSHSGLLSDILNVAGGFWLAYMFYAFLLYLVSDIGLFAGRISGLFAETDIQDIKKWRFIIVNFLTVTTLVAGFINAMIPKITSYEVSIPKTVPGREQMTIAAVSDIHLGSTIRRRSMRKLQETIGSLKPDMVLFLGDLVDGEIGPVLRGDLLSAFTCPPCREGVYAITGNHEYIGGIDKTAPYIRSKGIALLEDEVVKTVSGVTIIGRRDRDSFRFSGKHRASLKELLNQADTASPLILLDHQPLNPDEAASNDIDLQLSGHTHNGQMWPLSLLVKSIYKIPYGIERIKNTTFIVSSGYGLWGPRVRIGSRSEIVFITLKFSK